jgi:DNA-binding CsgD family transcriptional regulator
MTRFSHAALKRVHRFLLEVHTAPTAGALRELIPTEAARLIASDRANFNEFDVALGHRRVMPAPLPAYWQQLSPVLLAHMHEHPLGDPTQFPPLHRASMFADRRNDPAWRQSVLYHEYYLPAGARHQLFVPVVQLGCVRFSLAFNRARRGFSEDERALLELVSPHVAVAVQRAARLPRGREFTHREEEIARWLREGKRNAEIGAILGISSRTVGKHVEHIFDKLGVDRRTAAAWVLRTYAKA